MVAQGGEQAVLGERVRRRSAETPEIELHGGPAQRSRSRTSRAESRSVAAESLYRREAAQAESAPLQQSLPEAGVEMPEHKLREPLLSVICRTERPWAVFFPRELRTEGPVKLRTAGTLQLKPEPSAAVCAIRRSSRGGGRDFQGEVGTQRRTSVQASRPGHVRPRSGTASYLYERPQISCELDGEPVHERKFAP